MSLFDAKAEARKETKMEMTPMIDVTFLLLIFFLCTIKFKILEGKIPAYLPKDVGVNATPIDKQLEKIDIDVKRIDTSIDTKEDKKWVWTENQIEIRVQGRKMKGLDEFYKIIKKAHENNPDAKATLYPNDAALYIDCVKVVNECLRARFLQITFGGTRLDS